MDWKKEINLRVTKIKKEVGQHKALIGVSGGVDSWVTFELAYRAIGNQIIPCFFDDGFRRKNEAQEVAAIFQKVRGVKIKIIEVQDRAFKAVEKVKDLTGRIIRGIFKDFFFKIASEEGEKEGAPFLFLGTNAADREMAQKGQEQHNVDVVPEDYGFEAFIEPVEDLYKHQIRGLAKALGLPSIIVERMPFPGPGLAIRVLGGEITPEKIEKVKIATTIVEEEIMPLNPFQCLAGLTKDQALGLRNGERLFGEMILVRAVKSKDAITAKPLTIPMQVRNRLVSRIYSEIPSVTRVFYDWSPKGKMRGGTIEFI